jgi:hypothetical protein
MMKKTLIFFAGAVITMLALVKCAKQTSNQNEVFADMAQKAVNADGSAAAVSENAVACTPIYWELVVFPGGGTSYVYKLSGTPSCGPVSVSVLGQVKCAGVPVTFMTGLSYDPASGTFYGTTGPASFPANSLIKFTAATIGTASCTPLVNTCGIVLNVSDIERNQVTGVYYAINRGTVAANQRVVTINVGTAQVGCLNCTIPLIYNPRGLTFDCSGTMWIMSTAGLNGTLLKTTTSGCPTTVCPYPGPVTPPPAVAAPELGLHYDCCCNVFVTGNYDPVGPAPILTNGIPACFGAALYASVAGAIRPTVDFAR